ncbi:FkbM family methyltransferase [Christiangramia aquimixticola]|uniref:FkbM family methyltransferase n=1 Tax=Christiangramia aquimixticola TaxID=1697558 RepID=UPI003AA90C00
MLNLRKYSYLRQSSIIGKILRLPFFLIPKDLVVPILSGPLKGKKWITGAHNNSAWIGTYESRQSAIFVNKCKGKKVLWDLGAHAGYYTLLFKTVNEKSKVYSFEPVDGNYANLQKHIEINKLEKVDVIKKAVFDKEGVLKFAKGNSVGGKISENGDMTVPVVKLSNLLLRGTIEYPDVIKMDVEGAEYRVLLDLKDILTSTNKPLIFLSTHGKEIHDKCIELGSKMGFKVKPIDDNDIELAREFLLEPEQL